MATYKEIKGVTVQTLDSDPVVNAGSWSSGGNINEARYAMGGAGLTPTAAIIFGGSPSPGSPTLSSKTESYNGTSWTEVNDMPANRAFNAGVGTSTAAVSFGGTAPGAQNSVYEWDGTNWSSNPNAYPASYYSMAAAGTATAAIISGGNPAQTVVNTFDGTSFTSSTAMNTGRRGHGSVGTTTANLVSCGETPRTANTELWNGSSWTEVSDYPAATQDLSMWGTSTSALGALGYDTANTANSASWDGTSWTETAELANARNGAQTGGLGSDNTEGLVAGGDNSGRKNFTEEWGFPPVTSVVLTEGDLFLSGGTALKGFGKAAGIPAATWASGGSLNTARKAGSAGGRQTNAIAFAGFTTTMAAVAETYDGSSFTEVADLNTARRYLAGSGATGTAAIGFGGQTTTTNVVGNTETWNGSAWSEAADLNTSRGYLAGANFAPSSASLGFGGDTNGDGTGDSALTETWNGTSWTEVGDLNTGRRYLYGSGVQTSAILAGGLDGTSNVNLAETWDGSSWSEVAEINTTRRQHGAASASNSSAIIYGGYSTTRVANTEAWNGSSWSEVNDLSTARYDLMNAGSGVSAFGAGGETTTVVTTTEEWTVDNALSTVTVS
jgi:hypothetical protein